VTVRDSKGSGSGWAGADSYTWRTIDAAALTARALDKCLKAQNPVRIEPGRYTAILEPQAVCDFVGPMMRGAAFERFSSEHDPRYPFFKRGPTATEPGFSILGERVIDERLSISADPTDPELGFAPFTLPRDVFGSIVHPDLFTTPVYHPVTWIDKGVLSNLAYSRTSGISAMGRNSGLPNSGAFRMSVTGPTVTVEEMIATTKRGVLVTRFDQVLEIDFKSQLYRGYTRDGLWLIENGKISKAAKNLVFTESPLFALNKVEQIGVPQRTFHPNIAFLFSTPQPVMTPALKISDFSFTALSDAI
jgi:predicted Zn-dependent protease